ncbi:hypothetical protein F9278_36345 [Streptomyces phaeolivaceus]|uniref:Uncharacterized protein n=1 Tax=Streptomyces phaeolivaceus TaxID=2653200 RepID=A0A5P8KDN3_9ACTN|nr:hypothetical protein [Streptomyces phaeolivaceus]QFR00748.1 hypothetical protein F9278_36345 [Streptomyces phaeolivaceus]
MSPRLGLVADAVTALLADRLTEEMPLLPAYDIQRIADAQTEALAAAGARITLPVTALTRTTAGDTP